MVETSEASTGQSDGVDRSATRPASGNEKTFERQVAVCAFVVAMLAFLLHRTSAGALGPEDRHQVLANELISDGSLGATLDLVSGAAEAPRLAGVPGQPLALASLQLDTRLGAGPKRLSGYRRTNVALHALNAGLLVVLCAFLLRSAWAAGAAGLLFALHPLGVEPVLWLSARGMLLGSSLSLLSLVALVRGLQQSSRAPKVLAFLLFVLGLAAHPVFAWLALDACLVTLWVTRRLGAGVIPWLAVGGASLAWQGVGVDASRVGATLQTLLAHAAKLVVPSGLSVVVSDAAGGTQGLIGIDTLTTFVLMGAVVVLAILFATLARPGRGLPLRLGLVGLLALAAGFPLASATRARQGEWATGGLLYENAVRVAPEAALAHVYLARAYRNEGRPDEAIRAYQDAIAIDPFTPGAWHELGDLYYEREDLEAAVEAYENAAGLFPENAVYATSLAKAVASTGDAARALELSRLAGELDPDDARTQHELGLRLLLAGHDAEAEEHLAAAVRMRPRWTQARASYARFLITAERWEEARAELEAGIASGRGDYELHNNLAVVLTALGDDVGAVEHTEITARLRDDRADAHHNHGNALARAGKHEAALAAYDRALALDDALLPTVVNRALLLKEMGRRADAIAGLERATELAPDNDELRTVLENLRAND